MAKAIKCTLVFCGVRREIYMGEFPSISKAKKYAELNWERPYYINRKTEKENGNK